VKSGGPSGTQTYMEPPPQMVSRLQCPVRLSTWSW
jgi:hypothetical protein